MRTDRFQHEVVETTAIFGRKDKVSVSFTGEEAGVRDNTVVLPSLPDNAVISDEDAKVLRGYVDHEASGHLALSNLPLMHEKMDGYEKEGRKFVSNMVNAMEDIRIEDRVMKTYPGARKNLRATSEAVARETVQRLDEFGISKVDDPAKFLPLAVTWKGREDYSGAQNDELLRRVDGDVKEWLDSIDIEAVRNAKSTEEIIEMAEEVERQVKVANETPPPPSSGKGKGEPTDEKGEPGDGDGEGEGERSEAEADGGGGSPEAGKPEEEKTEGKSEEEKDEGGEASDPRGGGHGADGKAPFSLGEEAFESPTMKDVVDKTAEKISASEDAYYGLSDLDSFFDFERGWSNPKTRDYSWEYQSYQDDVNEWVRNHGRPQYERYAETLAGKVNLLRRALERALLAQKRVQWDGGYYEGKLDSRRMPSILSGKEDVFRDRSKAKFVNTAVSVVVDLSGSMSSGGKSSVATQCTIAIAEALERTGVAYEVVGFHNPTNDLSVPSHLKGRGYDIRTEPLVMPRFKRFDQSLNSAKGQMAALKKLVGGNNSDAEALEMAMSSLRKRREPRKVMLVLSDGHPAAHGVSYGPGAEELKRKVKQITASGVEVAGIGILSRAVAAFYPRYIVVSSVDDLTAKGLGMLSKMLLSKRVASKAA